MKIKKRTVHKGESLPSGPDLVNTIVTIEDRRLVSIVVKGCALTDEVRSEVWATADAILADTKQSCTASDCGARVDSYSEEVPEAGVNILAMGVLCTREVCGGRGIGVRAKL